MNPLVVVVLAVLAALAAACGALRVLGRIWVDYKVKIALLERLETRPDLVPSYRELQSLVSSISAARPVAKQDFAVTGAILGLIGLASVVWAGRLNLGRISSGIYLGGIVCVCLGFILALFGLLVRSAYRMPRPSAKDE